MNAINQNPYRVLGLFSDASARDIQKHKSKISLTAGVGKTATFDHDIGAFGEFPRTSTSVQEASSQIEQAKKKVFHALFWFVNSDHIDEMAFDYLKKGDFAKASQVWQRLVTEGNVTPRSFSSASNLSTLLLWIAVNTRPLDLDKFQTAIELKRKVVVSETFPGFVTRVAGATTTIDQDAILSDFLKEIMLLIQSYPSLSQLSKIKLLQTFQHFPVSAKQHLTDTLTTGPERTIEKWILEAKQNRTDKPIDGEIYGEELYDKTKADLQFLRQVWGVQSTQYQLLANLLAEEIRLCVHDFFMGLRDNEEYDPGEPALKVAKMARLVGPTGQYKGRVDEMIVSLEEWVEEEPERKRSKQLKEPIEFINNELELIKELGHQDSIDTAKTFMHKCSPKLNVIKNIVGSENSLYLTLSSKVAQDSMNIVIKSLNITIFIINNKNIGSSPRSNQLLLATYAEEAIKLIKVISKMDLLNEVVKNVNENKNALKIMAMPLVTQKQSQLANAQTEMNKIMEWQFGRSQEERTQQIKDQTKRINQLNQELKTLENALS